MRRLVALLIAFVLALIPTRASADSAWGSPQYGDPPSWCTNFSDMWAATVVTNDPLVGTNPEQDTFYGFHRNPGYDEWYGYFYGDFRGSPGDSSGWVRLLHETYPRHYHWNFASNGWAVHGHAKQYIAYYNWTFGGECGLGAYGRKSPPPYMADQYGYPVVDIYVDSVPPFDPQPRVAAVTPSSVAFTWDPVADRGDGAGRDYFVSGLDHYVSWLTAGAQPERLQRKRQRLSQARLAEHLGQRLALAQLEAAERHIAIKRKIGEELRGAVEAQPPPQPEIIERLALALDQIDIVDAEHDDERRRRRIAAVEIEDETELRFGRGAARRAHRRRIFEQCMTLDAFERARPERQPDAE